jgi:hypothetical protein
LGNIARLDELPFAARFCFPDDELRRFVVINMIVAAPREKVHLRIVAVKTEVHRSGKCELMILMLCGSVCPPASGARAIY